MKTVSVPTGSLDYMLSTEDSSVLRVYLRLLTLAQRRERNSCHISSASLAYDCGISQPSVIKGLKRLRELGFIETCHYRNPNKPCEHILKDAVSCETEVTLVAEPPFPQQIAKTAAKPEDKYDIWFRNVSLTTYNAIRAHYGPGLSQDEFRDYYRKFVAEAEQSPSKRRIG